MIKLRINIIFSYSGLAKLPFFLAICTEIANITDANNMNNKVTTKKDTAMVR